MISPAPVTLNLTNVTEFSTHGYFEIVIFFTEIAPVNVDDQIHGIAGKIRSLEYDFTFTLTTDHLSRRMIPIGLRLFVQDLGTIRI